MTRVCFLWPCGGAGAPRKMFHSPGRTSRLTQLNICHNAERTDFLRRYVTTLTGTLSLSHALSASGVRGMPRAVRPPASPGAGAAKAGALDFVSAVLRRRQVRLQACTNPASSLPARRPATLSTALAVCSSCRSVLANTSQSGRMQSSCNRLHDRSPLLHLHRDRVLQRPPPPYIHTCTEMATPCTAWRES